MSDESIETPGGDVPPSQGEAAPGDSESGLDRLTRGNVACLALKIMGLYLVVESLPYLGTLIEFLNGRREQLITTAAIPFLLPALGGIALIAFSGELSNWMLPRTVVAAVKPSKHEPAHLQAIAFSVVGLVLFARSTPYLVYTVVEIVFIDSRKSVEIPVSERIGGNLSIIIPYCVELILGVWLFFGSKHLSAMWWRIRHPESRNADKEPG